MAGKLIIFSAPSGAGKTTIVHHLLSKSLVFNFQSPRQLEKKDREK